MDPNPSTSPARQFERHDVEFDARLEPHSDHAEQFRVSIPDAQTGLAVIDVSKGGLGIKSGIFIPRNLRLTLHVNGVPSSSGGTEGTLRIRAIARRCKLFDYKPTYHVGLQYADPSGKDETRFIRAVTGQGVVQNESSLTEGHGASDGIE